MRPSDTSEVWDMVWGSSAEPIPFRWTCQIKSWHRLTAFSKLDIIPSAWSVTVRKTVNHLSSFSSSLRTWISFCTVSHSVSNAVCFRTMTALSSNPPAVDGTAVIEELRGRFKVSVMDLMPVSTNESFSSIATSDWSIVLVVFALSLEDWDLWRNSCISGKQLSYRLCRVIGEHTLTEDTCLNIRYRVWKFFYGDT